MSRFKTSLLLPSLAALLLLLAGCGDDDDAPSAPAGGGGVEVTGDVTAVQNYVPSDGGVTITIISKMGRTEHLLFQSLFTYPPPSQQTMDLYDVVRRVQVGDRVRADGTRTASGIALESVMILPGHGL